MTLTLNEAIKHAEEVADEKKKEACNLYDAKAYEESRECIWCSKEHRQLAEWLKELKKFREQEPCEDWCDVPSYEMSLEQAQQAVRDLRKIWAEHLEQEPILDKIRAEIAEYEEEIFHRTENYIDYAVVRHCLEIIDKYIESENKKCI